MFQRFPLVYIIRYLLLPLARCLLSQTKKTARYTERDEQQRAEFIETLNNLPNDAEIFYADKSGFE